MRLLPRISLHSFYHRASTFVKYAQFCERVSKKILFTREHQPSSKSGQMPVHLSRVVTSTSCPSLWMPNGQSTCTFPSLPSSKMIAHSIANSHGCPVKGVLYAQMDSSHALPASNRIQPTETTVFQVHATRTEYKLELDSDYHLGSGVFLSRHGRGRSESALLSSHAGIISRYLFRSRISVTAISGCYHS